MCSSQRCGATGPPTQAASLIVYSKCKEMCGRILKSHIVNLYRGMAKLKFKINVNLLQLLCIVVSAALHREFEQLCGFCVDCYLSTQNRSFIHSLFIHSF